MALSFAADYQWPSSVDVLGVCSQTGQADICLSSVERKYAVTYQLLSPPHGEKTKQAGIGALNQAYKNN